MENWKVELAAEGQSLEEVKIERGKLTLAIAVSYSNDSTQLGGNKFTKSAQHQNTYKNYKYKRILEVETIKQT